MTPAETFILVRAVQGACPQQKIDEYTPDMWHQLLDDIDFKDAQAAIVALDDLCDEADAEPLPAKGLLATDTIRAIIRGDQ
jgi:hypothetical protein